MKRIPLVALSLVLPIIALAATNNFTANGNIVVPGVTFGATTANMLIMSGSTAESWLFNSGAFTVTNPGSAFEVGSSDVAVKSIQVTQGSSTLSCTENTTPGTSYVTLPISSGTYTILPSATVTCSSLCSVLSNTATYNAFPTCGALSCNSGYQLSGSGASATCAAVPIVSSGGGMVVGSGASAPSSAGMPGYVKPRMQIVYPDGHIVYLDTPTQTATGATPTTLVPGVGTPTTAISPFTTILYRGMSSPAVSSLQAYLATDKTLYPEGKVTGYYGALTIKAVENFQLKYGIITTVADPGAGILGPKTRAKLNEVMGSTVVTVASQTLAVPPTTSASQSTSSLQVASSSIFTKMFVIGETSPDVRRLQILLATDKSIYPEGITTGYYGQLTKAAIERFQLKYGVVTSSKDIGYGLFGPKTRAKIQEVF